MFEDAVLIGGLLEFENQQIYLIERSKYNFEFNVWLQETKGFEYGNERQYQTFLTKNIFIHFLQYQNENEQKRITEHEREKSSWQWIKPYKDQSKYDLIHLIIQRTKLYDFLSVPAPDILHKNAFWHDKNELPIDYNIYHPKYGFPGLETISKDIVITSFNNVIIYQDERTGKYIHCKYYLQVLCTADEEHFINKDGEEVVKVNYLQGGQKKSCRKRMRF